MTLCEVFHTSCACLMAIKGCKQAGQGCFGASLAIARVALQRGMELVLEPSLIVHNMETFSCFITASHWASTRKPHTRQTPFNFPGSHAPAKHSQSRSTQLHKQAQQAKAYPPPSSGPGREAVVGKNYLYAKPAYRSINSTFTITSC